MRLWFIIFSIMKIISWNVNSVRARIDNILDYIKDSNPDILFLQEIKTQNDNFPSDVFKKIGYFTYVFGQKSYNGVAFISKSKIENVSNTFIKDKLKQSRIITGEILIKKKKVKLINIYVPNGNPVDTEKYDYKKVWLNLLINAIKKQLASSPNVIISGDFNVIPDDIDVYDSKRDENDALFRLEIRKKYRELINLGFIDVFRFLNRLKQDLKTDGIRHTNLCGKKIKRVAICGGSGSFLLNKAIASNADVFITGDFKYHQFFDADNQIIIADVGHYESEQFTSELIYEILNEKIPNFAVRLTAKNTNPLNYL